VLTIADEVATGFGRTGKRFACEHAGVTPDIMCVAKGLTGGYLPMAATITREEIYSEFCGNHLAGRELAHGHSFTGNPLAAAAACETLAIFREEKIPESLGTKIEFFNKGLEAFGDIESVGDVRRIGLIGAIELVADRKTKRPFPPEKRVPFRIAQKALENGILIRPLGNVLYFVPPYTITLEQIDTMLGITAHAVRDVLYE
jgi:adenosylmethionine-8-amino-7-oxononanoate aminotransferase